MMDETKVQIGDEVLFAVDISADWYISSMGYDGKSVSITLIKKLDRENCWIYTESQTDEDCDYCKMTHKYWYKHCDICKRKPKTKPQTGGYMAAEQAEDYHKMLDKAEHKVYGNIKDEPQICDTCRYYNSNIPCGSTPSACKEADKFAEEFVGELKKLKPKDKPQSESLEQFRVDLEYHTDTTHFGRVKGESITTNRVEDKPQT